MTKQESEKRLEQYWDGALTGIEIALMFIQMDLEQWTCPPIRLQLIRFATWVLNKADFMHR